MIPVFRKIRKKMADDNKPLKYLRYAIGEILLVVIGILIALSINNWNESQKMNKWEQRFLIDLKSELKSNLIQLERIDTNHKIVGKACIDLKALLNRI